MEHLGITGYLHSGKIRCKAQNTAARLLQTELEEPVKPLLDLGDRAPLAVVED